MLDRVGLTPCAGLGHWGLHARAELGSLGVPTSRGFVFMKILQNPNHEKTRCS